MLDFITQWDFSVLYFIQEHLRFPFLDSVSVFLSEAFDGGLLWIILCAGMLIFRKTRGVGVMILAAMGFALLIGEWGLKNIFCRMRPCVVDGSIPLAVDIPKSYSFPSGHTGSSFAAAFALFIWSKKWGIPALVLAGIIGLSRMYLFVHFPSDVLAGAVLGILCALLAGFLFKKFDLENKIQKIGINDIF